MTGKKDWFLYHADLDTDATPVQYGLLADLSNTKLVNPATSVIPAALTHSPIPKYIVPRHVILESSVSRFRRNCYVLNLTDFSSPLVTGLGVSYAYPTNGDEETSGTETYIVVGRVPEKMKRRVTNVRHSIITSETDPTATPA
jgi:hypothetical protein